MNPEHLWETWVFIQTWGSTSLGANPSLHNKSVLNSTSLLSSNILFYVAFILFYNIFTVLIGKLQRQPCNNVSNKLYIHFNLHLSRSLKHEAWQRSITLAGIQENLGVGKHEAFITLMLERWWTASCTLQWHENSTNSERTKGNFLWGYWLIQN